MNFKILCLLIITIAHFSRYECQDEYNTPIEEEEEAGSETTSDSEQKYSQYDVTDESESKEESDSGTGPEEVDDYGTNYSEEENTDETVDKPPKKRLEGPTEKKVVAPSFVLSRTKSGVIVKQHEAGIDFQSKGGFKFPDRPIIQSAYFIVYDGSISPIIKLSETKKGVVGKKLEYGDARKSGVDWNSRSGAAKLGQSGRSSETINEFGEVNRNAGTHSIYKNGAINLGTVETGSTPFGACGSMEADIVSVEFMPCDSPSLCKLKSDAKANITIIYQTKKAVTAGKVIITAKKSFLMYPFKLANDNLCSHTSLPCPIKAGSESKFSISTDIPRVPLSVALNVKIELQDASGRQLVCVKIPVIVD